jgi:thiol-disulfide isomerase/thioredoxin
MKRICVLLVIAVALGLLLPVIRGTKADSVHAAELREATSLPDSDLLDPAGEKVSFRSFVGGKPLVMVFWATWCPVCRAEVPILNRLNDNPAIRVLAINLGESGKKVRSFISSFNVGYPVVLDPESRTAAAYQVPGMPACIILDKKGRILYRGSVAPDNIEPYLVDK